MRAGYSFRKVYVDSQYTQTYASLLTAILGVPWMTNSLNLSIKDISMLNILLMMACIGTKIVCHVSI